MRASDSRLRLLFVCNVQFVMKIKILLVEDDTSLGFVISDQLRSDGYHVTLCTDGAEGFQKFNAEVFHLCIFDSRNARSFYVHLLYICNVVLRYIQHLI